MSANAVQPPPRSEPAISCPACRAGVTSRRAILQYKLIYLRGCDRHLELWMAADRAAREREEKKGHAKLDTNEVPHSG